MPTRRSKWNTPKTACCSRSSMQHGCADVVDPDVESVDTQRGGVHVFDVSADLVLKVGEGIIFVAFVDDGGVGVDAA